MLEKNDNTENNRHLSEDNNNAENLKNALKEISEILEIDMQNEEEYNFVVEGVRELFHNYKNYARFTKSMGDLTVKCAPEGYFEKQTPSLK